MGMNRLLNEPIDRYLARPALLICDLFGHDREIYRDGYTIDRRLRSRERWRHRCKRCHAGEPACWERGLFGDLLELYRSLRFRIRHWLKDSCGDCGKPDIRFGRKVGDRRACEPIPF